jgi:hypothetical protein
MASGTNVPTGSSLAERLYRPGLTHQAERQTFIMSFADSAKDSGIVLLDELNKKRGDKVQYRFSPTDDTRDGYSVGDTIQGTESDIEVLQDELLINYLGEAFKNDDPMSQQRVSWDMKQACFIKARTWWSRRFEQWGLNQLAGVTHAMGALGTNYKRTGLNPVIAVDDDHIFRPNAAANDGALGTNEKMSLDWINELMVRIQSSAYLDWPILPCPDGYWHLVIHPLSWRDLRQNTSPGDFQDLQRARLEGGQSYENSAFAKAYSGLYNMVKIHVSDFVPLGQSHSDATASVSDVRRCVLIGAGAAHMAFGGGYAGEGNHLNWTERIFDYYKWGVLADTIGGLKRTTYKEPGAADSTGITYGCMVMPVYAAA